MWNPFRIFDELKAEAEFYRAKTTKAEEMLRIRNKELEAAEAALKTSIAAAMQLRATIKESLDIANAYAPSGQDKRTARGLRSELSLAVSTIESIKKRLS